MSTMSLFEQYSAGAVLLFPSRRFCEELMNNHEQNNQESQIGQLELKSSYWTGYYEQGVKNTDARGLPPPFLKVVHRHDHVLQSVPGASEGIKVWYRFGKLDRCVPTALECTKEVTWWLDRADFYDTEWMPGIKYFDSWEEMIEMSQQVMDEEEHTAHMESIQRRNDEVYGIWRQLLEDKFPKLKGVCSQTLSA